MDEGTVLGTLLSPLKVGDSLFPGARLVGTSTELGLLLRVELDGVEIRVEVAPIEKMRARAAHTELLAFAYRTEGGRASIDSARGLRLCQEIAAIVAPNEDRVIGELRRQAAAEDDPGARIRVVQVQRALEPAESNGRQFYTINPYVGCVVGCTFCYAQSPIGATRALMGLADHAWGSYVEVRENLSEILAEEIRVNTPGPVKFCPIIADSYQPCEKKYRVTRRCLEVLADAGSDWTPLILTRTALGLRDLDLFARLPHAGIGISLPTIDDEVRRHFEPRAASVSERLTLLREIRAAGAKTFALVQPMMEGSVVELADAIAENADGVQAGVLEGVEGAQTEFADGRYRHTQDEGWQRDRAYELAALLDERGVTYWTQDIPPAGW